MGRRHRGWGSRVAVLTVALIANQSQAAFASPKGDLKDIASAMAQGMRHDGAPENRCALNAYFAGGHVTGSRGELKVGDRLLFVNGVNVQSTDQKFVEVLKSVPPTARIPVSVERNGQQIDLQVQCINAGDDQRLLLSGFDTASKKDVDECVRILAPIAAFDDRAAAMRLNCAKVSDHPEAYDISAMAYDLVRGLVDAARYQKDVRATAIQNLRAYEGVLGPGRFTELVNRTKGWPGDETLFEDSKPNWSEFKKSAEAQLKGTLIDPTSAMIQWPHGFIYGQWRPFLGKPIEGYWTCGLINAKNRMGGYVGTTYFVIVMSQTGVPLYSDMGDGSTYDVVSAACQKSISQLPPAPPEFAEGASEPLSGSSVADQLAKLANLKASGALTDEEYQAAKAKVLAK